MAESDPLAGSKQVGDIGGPIPDFPTAPGTLASGAANVAKTVLGKIAPRAAEQSVGAEIGGAAGAATGIPGAPIVGAALGGGIANVLGSKTPEAIGGDPSESTLHAFGWGAGPEAIARGGASALESRAAKKAAEATHDAVVDAIDKGANPSPAEQAGKLATVMGRTTLEAPKPLTGTALTDATNTLKDEIQEPITQMRQRLGDPIGQAYESLKGKDHTFSDQDMRDLQEAAQGVRDDMLSPYPKAKAIFNKIRKWQPPPDPAQGGNLETLLQRTDQGDYIVKRQMLPGDVDSLRLQNFTEEQISKMLEASKHYKPPTPDELREARQVVSKMLSTAQGGDKYALGGIRQAFDEKLMPLLPAGINRDRELYAGFMKNFPWRDVNKVNQMGTPRDLSAYAFDPSKPERTMEIVQGASPKGKIALKEALTNRVLDAVDPNAPLADQVKAARGVLTPYIKNGAAAALYGSAGAEEARQLFYLPEHMAQMKQIVDTPEFKKEAVNQIAPLLKGNKSKINAIEQGWDKVVDSLPQKEQEVLRQPTIPGAEMPVLPTSQQALEAGMKPGEATWGGRMARRAEFTAPYAGARAITGNPVFAAGQIAAMAGIATTAAGYRALMDNVGASTMAKIMSAPNSATKVRFMLEGLAALGTQTERVATQKDEQPSPW